MPTINRETIHIFSMSTKLLLTMLLVLLLPGSAFAQSQLEGKWGHTIRLTRGPSQVLNLTVEAGSHCIVAGLNAVEYEPEASIVHVSISVGPSDFGSLCAYPRVKTYPIGQLEALNQYQVMVYHEFDVRAPPGTPLFQPDNLIGELSELSVSKVEFANQVPVISGYMLAVLSLLLALVGVRFHRRGAGLVS